MDLSDLVVEYSIYLSNEEGGMLGWVRKGQMVLDLEEVAFNALSNKVVRCKTKFGWHLLQVISEWEESLLHDIQPEELHAKMQDPIFYFLFWRGSFDWYSRTWESDSSVIARFSGSFPPTIWELGTRNEH